MRKSTVSLMGCLVLGLVGLMPLVGCNQGPAERAGQQIDHAARDVRDTLDPPKSAGEAIGRKIDDATGKAP